MKKITSDFILALLLFFLSSQYVFAKVVLCMADNNQTYRIEVKDEAHGQYTETLDWIKGKKAGTRQKIIIQDINKPDFMNDYLQLTDGKYTITYALRCSNE